jgi:Mg-chelatase subunit ChlD
MDNFKFSDLDLSNVSPSGQSALGPALVIATGIVSGYGSGSLIVVITDGKANKGIFSEGGLYEE